MVQSRSGEQAPMTGHFRSTETGWWEEPRNLPNKTVWSRRACLVQGRQKKWPDAVLGSRLACLAEFSWTHRTGIVS